MGDSELTPLMRQYQEIKRAYQDAILFFRVGDFYEMFYDDAVEASRLLSIALTSRDRNRADPVPLCGVPFHAATGYICKLLKAGRTVALCDQVEDPKIAKGLVRREVVRLYTPGTLVDSELLSPNNANFLVAVAPSNESAATQRDRVAFGLAVIDISTGQFWIQELAGHRSRSLLFDELTRLDPREIILPTAADTELKEWMVEFRRARVTLVDQFRFLSDEADRLLREHFRVASLDAFGCKGLNLGIRAAGAAMSYLRMSNPTANLGHLDRLEVRRGEDCMHLDSATIRNLELVRGLGDEEKMTLFSVLDTTVSPMGCRLLREWVLGPLVKAREIEGRLEGVQALLENLEGRQAIRENLKKVQDLPRLNSRIIVGSASPRDLLALKQSASALPDLGRQLRTLKSPLIEQMAEQWDDLRDVSTLIERSILPDAPQSVREGGIIRDGFDVRLDELRTVGREGKHWIAKLEANERERTGIESLKVRYNQVFGYYIEVTKANLGRVPPHYVRKQTLSNAERYMTPELKELEEQVTGAELKLIGLERELFDHVRCEVSLHSRRLTTMGQLVACLDVLAALAECAARYGYVRPEITEGGRIVIKEGRHPVVERMNLADGFIANDTLIDLSENRLLIITGPNMAGKSTYLRQVALIVLLAQIGSYVPAAAAHIGLVDRIFTRVGASDNLAAGQSTFMVEMIETSAILNCASSRSLILLDEIGRGTSTYDGLSIAWAVAEFIQDRRHLGARTLFATHYHEMTGLAQLREGIRNYTVAVRERNDEVLFLRKIVQGAADRSYGIHVARLAGLPERVLIRATEVLAQLEGQNATTDKKALGSNGRHEEPLPLPHPIIEEVRQLDLYSMTPLDAMNRLADFQRRLLSPQ